MVQDKATLVSFTAGIVAAHVANNNVALSDVAPAIAAVYGALEKLGTPAAESAPEKPKGVVSARASIKPEHLVSMIDGKPYRMLKRHLSLNGYTPESYREAFGLPKDYPMVAANYAETRRALAHKIGLGRKPKAAPEPTPAPAPKRGRKPTTPA